MKMREESNNKKRFEFGKNWQRYLDGIPDRAVEHSQRRLGELCGERSLQGLTFLDVGSGSGLSSLAAFNLGAAVTSFDLDHDSVQCTRMLQQQHCPTGERWTVLSGSVLDKEFLNTLGSFDIVYSWGVLHHTGAMWTAIENLLALLKADGALLIALYNDQGIRSSCWYALKKIYNHLPHCLRPLLFWPVFIRIWGPTTIRDIFHGNPFHTWKSYVKERGMSPMIDAVDWIGGFPFEVATPEEVVSFFEGNGFQLTFQRCVGNGYGCNEFAFKQGDSR